jgi:uncharacterized protein (TIGR02145 family)
VSFTTTTAGSVTDVDGNTYTTVTIGMQVWMKENLKVSKYRNSDPIPTNFSDSTWKTLNTGAYSIYNNNPAYDSLYGKLYNWYAVADPRGLCPVGWRVPTDHDWQFLTKYLDPDADTNQCCSNIAGGKMKNTGNIQAGTGLWSSPNVNATNSSGFSALPAGLRFGLSGIGFIGTGFSDMAFYAYWWSSTSVSTSYAKSRFLWFNNASSSRDSDFGFKEAGFSVRCLRD